MRELRVERTFVGTPEEVFQGLTDPAELARWWGPGENTAEVELRVGGQYRLSMKLASGISMAAVGTYTEIAAPERLGFTFAWEGDSEGETHVLVELRPRETGTELILTHTGILDKAAWTNYQMGWNDCLGRLEALTGGKR